MNIIYEIDKNKLRLISANPNISYQLNELRFYIPKKQNITPFLLIKDSNDNKDILRLTQIESDKNYNIYTVSTENSVTIDSAQKCSISLLNFENNINFSAFEDIHLSFDNYLLGNQIYLIENLSNKLMTTYKQIEELTKINIEIYQKIKEV